MKHIAYALAGCGAGLIVGFLLGTITQFKCSCVHCIERRMDKILGDEA